MGGLCVFHGTAFSSVEPCCIRQQHRTRNKHWKLERENIAVVRHQYQRQHSESYPCVAAPCHEATCTGYEPAVWCRPQTHHDGLLAEKIPLKQECCAGAAAISSFGSI